ncbi:MAG: MG2 domain-containing protein [Planctomycetota bacterium]|jgi:hypothetical protein
MTHSTLSPRPTSPLRFGRGLAAAGVLAACATLTGIAWSHNASTATGHFQAHLAFDKPIYRPGETVWVRTTVLDAVSHKPLARQMGAAIEVRDPSGAVVHTNSTSVVDSVMGMGWRLPKSLPGGVYTLKVTVANGVIPATERTFEVRRFRQRRLRTQMEFLRKGYGPGDTVQASLKVARSEGGIPAGAEVTFVARVDGKEVHRGMAKVTPEGFCSVAFALPKEITSGQGSLTLVVRDGGVVESAAKTIPILLDSMKIAAYPEGGDLVAGLPCGLYLQAHTPWGDPADITAEVVDQHGAAVALFSTTHEGRGRAQFVPAPGATYTVRVVRPAGITTKVQLPKVMAQGVSLAATQPAYAAGAAVGLKVCGTEAGEYTVVLARQDKVLSTLPIRLEAREPNTITFHPGREVDGVLRATVYDAKGLPRAERLLFRRSLRRVQVHLEPSKEKWAPGEQVTVKVRTTDQYGEAMPAVVGLTVTDDAVLQMVETRKQTPRLLEMVMLESEVRSLDDAQIYLQDGPEADAAVDLLLGTQGWRRFAYEDAAAFLKRHGDAGRRALGHNRDLEAYYRSRMPKAPSGGAWGEDAPRRGEKLGELERDGGADPDRQDREGGPEEHNEAAAGGEKQQPAGKPMEAKSKAAFKDELRDDKGFAGGRAMRKQSIWWERVYAHPARGARPKSQRTDFTETLYWAAGLKTDAKGEASFTFGLSDSITSFRVMADAFTAAGDLGGADAILESREPFYVEPKLPLEVTSGDKLLLPIAAVNETGDTITVKVAGSAGGGLVLPKDIDLGALLEQGERGRLYLPVEVNHANGEATVTITASAGVHSDSVSRKVTVRPYGFPFEAAAAGMLERGATHRITVPKGVRLSSIRASAQLYPSPAADLAEALKGLVAHPGGCFEQTSSTSYPMVMAQRYFTTHTGVDPALIAKAHKLIEYSYKRLAGQFTDMSHVYDGVDGAMLARTKGWMLGRRDGTGGFNIRDGFYHSWGCPKHVTEAYLLWALTEAGVKGLEKEVEALTEQALEKPDSYFRALLAMACENTGRAKDFERFAAELARAQTKEGMVGDAATTVVASRGVSLNVETTALAALAWMRHPKFHANAELAVRWLLTQRSGGRFGSTQATVLALRALVERDQRLAKPLKGGIVSLWLDGSELFRVPFNESSRGVIQLPAFADRLTPGAHTIELKMQDGSPMPYALRVEWFADTPDSSTACEVGLEEGETTEVQVTVRNLKQTAQPMAVAIIGLPGGLEPRHAQLKELVEAGTLAHYEVRGREVVAYFQTLKPGQVLTFPVDVTAAVPGEYTGDASRAYLYYADEDKVWIPGLKIRIDPR